MAKITIEEAKAKIWMGDVQTELDEIKTLLEKVHSAVTERAGEDDSIMKGIDKVGKTMENSWNSMCKGLKDANNKVEEAIKKIVKSGQEVLESADELNGKMHY